MVIKRFFITTLFILLILVAGGCAAGMTDILDPPTYDPPVFETGKFVAVNIDGWIVKKYTRKLDTGYEITSYEMYDPVLNKWYPAVAYQDGKVTMSDHGKELWRKDRMALPEDERLKALPKKPEVESDEEINYGGCFAPRTQILMADGGLREISSMKDGQMVKSYDIERNVIEDRKVLKTYLFKTPGYYLINGELKATARHKFLMASSHNTWKKASELRPGDKVQSVNGEITINTIEELKEKGIAHNFEVADTKAYIVKGGEHYYVVHNGL